MKVKTFIIYPIFISIVCGISSCSPGKAERDVEEGSIEYSASVVDENHPLAGLAPSSASVKLKDGKFVIEMSTMGIFNTSYISDSKKKTLVQLVKFMDVKDACIETVKDIEKEDKDYQLTFQPSDETKVIAGYKCKKTVATLVSNPSESFDVYYTEDIGSDSTNILSPYKSIHGMLMDYRLKKLGIEMHFTATSVKKESVQDNVFDIPAYYKIVTREEMNMLFADIMK